MSEGDSRRAWAATLVGRTIHERYRLERLLAVGGMGAVYEARHLEVDRLVAVKTVVPGALDEAGTARLRREARQAASLGGRGVVDVMDFGVDEVSGPFLVMELLRGETLAARIDREGPLPIDDAVALARELLGTLAAVHERGIVHRDLKPANVFLVAEGLPRTRILDFGLARRPRSDDETLTAPGAIVGTPRFMAPEQVDPDGEVDHRADLWAVGAILYTLLAGRRPYEEWSRSEVLTAAAAGPPRPLAELRPEVPPALVAVVERAMAIDPAERFVDSRAFDAALAAAWAGEPPSAVADLEPSTRSLSPRRRAPTPRPAPRQRRATPLVGALAAVALGTLGVLGLYTLGSEPPAVRPTPNAPVVEVIPAPVVEVIPARVVEVIPARVVEPQPPPVSEPAEVEAVPSPEPVEAPAPAPRRAPRRTSATSGPARAPAVGARSGTLAWEDF